MSVTRDNAKRRETSISDTWKAKVSRHHDVTKVVYIVLLLNLIFISIYQICSMLYPGKNFKVTHTASSLIFFLALFVRSTPHSQVGIILA